MGFSLKSFSKVPSQYVMTGFLIECNRVGIEPPRDFRSPLTVLYGVIEVHTRRHKAI